MAQFPKYIPVDEQGNVLAPSAGNQSDGVIQTVTGMQSFDSYGAASQNNTLIDQTVNGEQGIRFFLQHIVFGYSDRPTQPRQVAILVDGQIFWSTWITEAGAGPVNLGFALGVNQGFRLLLPASGQAGILGDLWLVAGRISV